MANATAIYALYAGHTHEAACEAVYNAGFDAGLMAETTSTTPLPDPNSLSNPAPVVEEKKAKKK